MKFDTQVYIRKLPADELLKHYCNDEMFLDSCQACSNYGKVWSCPPNLPDIHGYLEEYKEVFVIAVKVLYPEETRTLGKTAADAKLIREQTYEQVKKRLLLGLLAAEEVFKAGKCLGAGRCILCDHCSREAGKPCRYPKRRRYSVTGFGFDFAKLLQELFDIAMIWSNEGLPEYDVAVAMFAI